MTGTAGARRLAGSGRRYTAGTQQVHPSRHTPPSQSTKYTKQATGRPVHVHSMITKNLWQG